MSKYSLPNFILAGAMKSGTTSLYNYLKEHPQIYMPRIKEPKFFISSTLLKKEKLNNKLLKRNATLNIHKLDDYKSLYSNVNNEIAIGETSPQYLFTYETTIPLIKKYLGDIKRILILRNPINRAYSAYKHNRRYNLHAPHLNEKLNFIDALKIEDARIKTRNFPIMYFYKSMGLYYDQVKSYKDNFSQVFVCKFEDLETDPLSLMKKIYSFLEVDHNFMPNVEIKYNIAQSKNLNFIQKAFLNFDSQTRWKIMQKTGKIIGNHNLSKIVNFLIKEDKSKPDEHCRIFLINEIKEDILKLENLIDQDLQDLLK